MRFSILPHLHRHTASTSVTLALATLLVSGCASMSGIAPHAARTDSNSLALGSAIGTTPVDAHWPSTSWWQSFGDPQLDALVQQAIGGSPNLKIARARVGQARWLAGVARAGTLPQVAAKGEFTRERFTEQGLIPPPLAGNWEWDNEITLQASYDLDLWGKESGALEAALDVAHVSAAEARSVQLNLETAVVRSYLQLSLQYALRDIAIATLQQQQAIANIARRRLAAGLDTQLELSEAETALPNSRANIEQNDEAIALLRNQLAALIGLGPGAGDAIQRPLLAQHGALRNSAQLPIRLPAAVPANLIGRRPDVVAQRWRVEAAGKNIDVAKASFYPNINISAFLGFQSLGFAGFLTDASAIRGIAPAISLPIFEGGRLRSKLGTETAAYDAAVESYNNTLVVSLQSVADQIVKLKSSEEQQRQSQQALVLAQKSYDIAQRGFHAGLTEYLSVLNTQTALLRQQQRIAQVHVTYLDAWAQLMQALGGGLGDDLPTPEAQAGPVAKDAPQ